MRRREFLGCAAALSLAPSQGTSPQAVGAAQTETGQATKKEPAKLKLARPIVDIGIV
jgi:hypothetical protein